MQYVSRHWKSQSQREGNVQEMIDLSNSAIAELIEEWIHNQKYRKILYRRLVDGITYEALAVEFDMSVRQIKHIVYTGETQIYRHVKSDKN